jgi:hypothetical protein
LILSAINRLGASAVLLLTKLCVETGDEAAGEVEGGRPTNLTDLPPWKTVLRGRVAARPRCFAQEERWGRGRQLGTWRPERQGGQWSRREVQEQEGAAEGEVKEAGWRRGQVEQEAEEEVEEREGQAEQVHPLLRWAARSSRLLSMFCLRRCQ